MLLRAVVSGIHVALVVGQRHLGVDDYVAVVGKVQDEVGYHAATVVTPGTLAALVLQRLLGVKLFAFVQLQVFQQLPELQFAEVALHLDLACQCPRQTVCRLADGSTLLHVDFDGFVESRQGFSLLLLGFGKGFLHVFQTLLQRVDDFGDLFLVLFAQLLLTQFEHLLGGCLHLLLDEVELVFHLFGIHLLQDRNLAFMSLFRLCELLVERGFHVGNLLFEDFALGAQLLLIAVALGIQLAQVVGGNLFLSVTANHITHYSHRNDGYNGYDER